MDLGVGPDERHPALFAAGVLAWIDADENVHVFNLATGGDRVVGQAGPPRRAIQLALTSEFVAWMDSADRVHLLPLGDVQAGTPRYLGAIETPDFSPVEDQYDPQGETNRPLQSWTMTIRSAPTGVTSATAQGPIVRTLKGSAKSGAVRPTWNGKDAGGTRVPDGVYTWSLTGTGPGGKLAVTTGGTKPISGTVRVDSRTPTPKLSLPRVAA
jgi:hypothetical protein